MLILAGPTSAGKTAAALAVAEAYDAVIVSADAMQVYRGMDIGTGKASAAEQARARHFGIDVRAPDQRFDAADFVTLADAVRSEHRRVIIAGGTSLYIHAFVRGLVATPTVDPVLRERLGGLEDPHARLRQVDPALAGRLHPNDVVRIVRGLEVFEATGQRLSALQAAHREAPDRVKAVGLWLDRGDLEQRIDARVLAMIASGYVDEVRWLLDVGHARTLKPMQSLGYRHLCAHVADGLELGEAIRRTQRDTRQFARKQRNWMRKLGYERRLEGHVQAAMVAGGMAFGGAFA